MSAALRAFGERGKLFAIHFRNVRGLIPRFEEVFQDEGDYSSSEQMRTLHEVGFDGFVMPDHYPRLLGDNDAQDRARAWSVGYLRALIQATAA
jgi:mannonate dehydratase